jgi:carotenoid cleavage dioxygenase
MRKENFFRNFGIVNRQDTQKGIPGMRVQALDKDLFFYDRLDSVTTDGEGRFEIRYTESDFSDFFDLQPDIYLKMIDADGTELFTTEDKVRYREV